MVVTSDRHERIAALNFNYQEKSKQAIDVCNLCGSGYFTVISHVDRYGFPVDACACMTCGLVFLNPVMNKDSYLQFYRETYRPLVSAYHGREINEQSIQAEQCSYAEEKMYLLSNYLRSEHQTLLDIGGSTGIVAHRWAQKFNLEATVLDPAPLELDQAKKLGIKTISGLLEEFKPDSLKYDIVVLCQTVDHLLDIKSALIKIRELLSPNGLLFIDIVDFRAAYLRSVSVEKSIKIDHPYYLTEYTMENYLISSGFLLSRKDYASDHLHISYICHKNKNHEGQLLLQHFKVINMLSEIRIIQNIFL